MSEPHAPAEAAGKEAREPPIVRMLVVSDLHAISDESRANASGAATFTAGNPTLNALDAVHEIIERYGLRADLLLCPGDLADGQCGDDGKGGTDVEGMRYAWGQLQDLARRLGCARLIATAGNHDIYRPPRVAPLPASYDPSLYLKNLVPPFPTLRTEESAAYFRDDFVIVDGPEWRVVSLNTCADRYEHHTRGAVRSDTIEKIAEAIKRPRAINVLLCHHHPVQWTYLKRGDEHDRSERDHMRLGEELLRMLDVRDAARWLVLHGHRHIPMIGYAGESTSGPVRFSAGSVAYSLFPEISMVARNQFYLLEFAPTSMRTHGLPLAGRFIAWDWLRSVGPRPARRGSGLPHRGGFGFRRDGHEIAGDCLALSRRLGVRRLDWQRDVVAEDPRRAYLAPNDLEAMALALRRDGGMVLYAEDGSVEEVHLGRP